MTFFPALLSGTGFVFLLARLFTLTVYRSCHPCTAESLNPPASAAASNRCELRPWLRSRAPWDQFHLPEQLVGNRMLPFHSPGSPRCFAGDMQGKRRATDRSVQRTRTPVAVRTMRFWESTEPTSPPVQRRWPKADASQRMTSRPRFPPPSIARYPCLRELKRGRQKLHRRQHTQSRYPAPL